jgi:hypothetical protein
MMRLLLGRQRAGVTPALSQETFELGLLAILLHDSGYLKRQGDLQGTGAKYTITHVSRSAEFASEFLRKKEFSSRQISAVQNMIRCTGVNTKPSAIPFQSEAEKIAGYALATGDILGQMAAEDYVDKLPILYSEFVEAAHFSGDKNHFVASFQSAADLIEKTPGFWENIIQKKLEREFSGLYRFLNHPYPSGPNYYVQKIEANMERLRRRLVPA